MFNFFSSVLAYFAKYGNNMLIPLLMIFFFLSYFYMGRIVEKSITKSMEESNTKQEAIHNTRLDYRRTVNPKVDDILSTYISSHDSVTRIFICEYHNSNANIADLPFYKFTITYEEDNINIRPIKLDYQNINISMFKSLYKLSSEPYCIEDIETLKEQDHLLYYILKDLNGKYIMGTELCIDDKPFGALVVCKTVSMFNEVEIRDFLKCKNEISKLLILE